jgi:uncharacterized protein YhhL (DUF1145 family)
MPSKPALIHLGKPASAVVLIAAVRNLAHPLGKR